MNNQRRWLALSLAGIMTAGALSACAAPAATAPAASGDASAAPAAEAAESGEAAVSEGSGTSFSFFGAIWDPYKESSDIFDQWQADTGSTIDFEFVQEDSYDTQLAARVASQDLPDVIKKEDGNVNDLIAQGLLLPITDYLEEYMPNYMSRLKDEDMVFLTNADDGEIYGISLIVDNEAAYSTFIRSDWLSNVGLELPGTWDEWVAAWTAFKEQDANGNGDTTDEIPLAIGYDSFYMFENFFGINSNGYFAVEDGKYIYDPENPKYEAFLDNMRDLYEAGILYQEFITCDDDQLDNIGAADTLGSTVTWAELAKNYSLACIENGDEDALYTCVTPVVGPNGDASIQARNKISRNTFFTIAAKDRLPEILKTFDYLYSPEGITLTNYGIEGVHYELVDGEPVVQAPYNESFRTARGYDLIPSIIPFDFLHESYMQYLMGGASYDELDAPGKSFVDGLNINDDYFYHAAPVFTTDAWTEHFDLVEQQIALRDNYIMGKISKDDYNAQYEQLKAAGLQEVIDAAQAAYDAVAK